MNQEPTNPTAFEETDWQSLIFSLTARRQVLPVIGEDLSRVIEPDGTSRHWNELLEKELGVARGHDLNAGDVRFRSRVSEANDRLLRRVYDGELRIRRGEPIHVTDLFLTEEMKRLLSIRDFRLMLTTATDGLLLLAARLQAEERDAIFSHRPDWNKKVVPLHCDVSSQASALKFSETWQSSMLGKSLPIFHLFGLRASGETGCALRDAQQLERIIKIISESGYSELRSILREKHVIVLGNRVPDCFIAAFIRLIKGEELEAAGTREYFAPGKPNPSDPSLLRFLNHLGSTTLFEDRDVGAFIHDLHRRWNEQCEPEITAVVADDQQRPPEECVFVSYASEDRAIARKIVEFLKGRNIKVWLDKDRLEGGAKWEPQLKTAVDKCRIFLPVLTANSLRPDGDGRFYFKEWRWAEEQSKRRTGVPYIFPFFGDDLSKENKDFCDSQCPEFRAHQGLGEGIFFTDDGARRLLDAYNTSLNARKASK